MTSEVVCWGSHCYSGRHHNRCISSLFSNFRCHNYSISDSQTTEIYLSHVFQAWARRCIAHSARTRRVRTWCRTYWVWRGWTRAHRATTRPVRAARARWTLSSAASRNTRPATWVTGPPIQAFMCDFFSKVFGGQKSFLWGHWYPWWRLLWVSKPKWAALLALAKAYMLHVPWDSSLVWHPLISWQPA